MSPKDRRGDNEDDQILWIQKNVNRTIKDGLKKLRTYIEEPKKHQQTDNALDRLDFSIGTADWNHVERNKKRDRRHALAFRKVAVEARKWRRRPDNPEEFRGDIQKKKKEEAPQKQDKIST